MVERGEVVGGTHLVVADTQTGGVGRLGRKWSSPRGGLWCTLVIAAPSGGFSPALAIVAGLACLEAIEEAAGAGTDAGKPGLSLRWPNDVLCSGRKVAGVLTETVLREGRSLALIGVGINANCSLHELPAALQERATTLRRELGREVGLVALRDGLARRLGDAARADENDLVVRAGSRLAGVGERREVRLPSGESVEGIVRGLGEGGALLLELEGGTVRAMTTGEGS